MRVTGGELAGRKLIGPKKKSFIRPTSDRMRETLFNILIARNWLQGAFCDLFAGTGSVGIEALSRGAEFVQFFDSSRDACRIIRSNLDKLQLTERAEVVSGDIRKLVRELIASQCSVYFADPPYEQGFASFTLKSLGNVVDRRTCRVVVIQHDRREQIPQRDQILKRVMVRPVGDTHLSFYVVED